MNKVRECCRPESNLCSNYPSKPEIFSVFCFSFWNFISFLFYCLSSSGGWLLVHDDDDEDDDY